MPVKWDVVASRTSEDEDDRSSFSFIAAYVFFIVYTFRIFWLVLPLALYTISAVSYAYFNTYLLI